MPKSVTLKKSDSLTVNPTKTEVQIIKHKGSHHIPSDLDTTKMAAAEKKAGCSLKVLFTEADTLSADMSKDGVSSIYERAQMHMIDYAPRLAAVWEKAEIFGYTQAEFVHSFLDATCKDVTKEAKKNRTYVWFTTALSKLRAHQAKQAAELEAQKTAIKSLLPVPTIQSTIVDGKTVMSMSNDDAMVQKTCVEISDKVTTLDAAKVKAATLMVEAGKATDIKDAEAQIEKALGVEVVVPKKKSGDTVDKLSKAVSDTAHHAVLGLVAILNLEGDDERLPRITALMQRRAISLFESIASAWDKPTGENSQFAKASTKALGFDTNEAKMRLFMSKSVGSSSTTTK